MGGLLVLVEVHGQRERMGEWMEKRGIVRPTIISEFNAQGAEVAGQIAMMRHMAKRLDEAAAARDRVWMPGCGRRTGFR